MLLFSFGYFQNWYLHGAVKLFHYVIWQKHIRKQFAIYTFTNLYWCLESSPWNTTVWLYCSPQTYVFVCISCIVLKWKRLQRVKAFINCVAKNNIPWFICIGVPIHYYQYKCRSSNFYCVTRMHTNKMTYIVDCSYIQIYDLQYRLLCCIKLVN